MIKTILGSCIIGDYSEHFGLEGRLTIDQDVAGGDFQRKEEASMSTPRSLTIELLREIEAQVSNKPVLQAIAIYDCEATRESVVVLQHYVDFMSVVLLFGLEAGPVVRWFFKPKLPSRIEGELLLDSWHEVAPINRHGCAAVMSQKTFDTYKGLLSEEELQPTVAMILQPQVYDLNKDKRDG